jgi:putative membrane protein
MGDRIVSKQIMLVVLSTALAIAGYGQSNTATQDRQSNTKTGTNDALAKLIEMNVAEVEAGKLAIGKAENAKVKDFAQMMVDDHTQALTKLRGLQGGQTSDVKPNAKHQQTADRLAKLSGAQFDRQYMQTMVNDHQQAVRFLEQQAGGRAADGSTGAGHTDLSAVARELLPTVRKHLQEAQQIQKELQSATTSPRTKPGDQKSSDQTPRQR